MCTNAASQAGNLLAAERPTLVSFLAAFGTPAATVNTVLAAYDALTTGVQNYKKGSAPTEIAQLVQDFDAVFNALPVPAEYKALGALIAAGVTAALGLITANAPAPAGTTQEVHANAVAEATASKGEAARGSKPGFWETH